jgi:hypothetical protein
MPRLAIAPGERVAVARVVALGERLLVFIRPGQDDAVHEEPGHFYPLRVGGAVEQFLDLGDDDPAAIVHRLGYGEHLAEHRLAVHEQVPEGVRRGRPDKPRVDGE